MLNLKTMKGEFYSKREPKFLFKVDDKNLTSRKESFKRSKKASMAIAEIAKV